MKGFKRGQSSGHMRKAHGEYKAKTRETKRSRIEKRKRKREGLLSEKTSSRRKYRRY